VTIGLTDSQIQIRRLTDADLPAAQALSAEAAWPHRLEDWQFALGVGAGLGAFARSGDLVATTLWWPYGPHAATLGLVITATPHQGRGIGRRMMDAALEAIGPRSVMLNATQAGLRLYEATGFVLVARVRQHQGVATALPTSKLEPGAAMRPMIDADRPRLIALDAAATGMQRATMLGALIDLAEGVVLERDGRPVGFSLLRRFGRGHVVGPVVAPAIADAQVLIAHWLAARPGHFIRVDLPARAMALSPWLTGLGLHQVGDVATMLRGAPPSTDDVSALFALVSQALG
jgi:GNAT superfamily N-acetyltransferase